MGWYPCVSLSISPAIVLTSRTQYDVLFSGVDLEKCTSRQLFQKFLLADETVNFTGHALALYTSDDYLDKPAREMVERVKLYAYSVSRYGNSPYIYPVYGIGGLPEGFSRFVCPLVL